MTVRSGPPLSISAVERETGLSKDTLRVWERRYGFPRPERDPVGERLYPLEQVDRLRLIRRLMDAGHRPGKVVGLPVGELHALVGQRLPASAQPAAPAGGLADLGRFVQLTKSHRIEELRRALAESALRMGLDRFVTQLAAPLNRVVGEAWARGDFEVFEEHLYTEAMQGVLRTAIGSMPASSFSPRVLLTTFPSEPHGLGLLMAEALLALEGCRCLSLGVQTPIRDIALAAEAHGADI
ncbi:MAG: MerR family transcriptional regulator, partial [Burkholderiales bacterium]